MNHGCLILVSLYYGDSDLFKFYNNKTQPTQRWPLILFLTHTYSAK